MSGGADRRYCLASTRILHAGRPVGLMYRDRPFGPDDSGWRFFAGDESGEFAADPRNVEMCDLVTLAALVPDVARWLDLPVGAACERTADGELRLHGREKAR